jgi:hypothetical protein
MLDEARVEQGSSDFDPNLILGPEPTYPPINVAREVIKLTPSGGLSGISTQLLIPMWDSKSGRSYIGTLDYNDFNTEEASLYAFRMEDVLPGRQITVSRVQVTYRDLGPATLTAIVETAQGVIYDEKKIGTPSGDGSVKSQYFDLEITGERPQLSLFRDKNSGPVSIISAKMITDVEIAEQV